MPLDPWAAVWGIASFLSSTRNKTLKTSIVGTALAARRFHHLFIKLLPGLQLIPPSFPLLKVSQVRRGPHWCNWCQGVPHHPIPYSKSTALRMSPGCAHNPLQYYRNGQVAVMHHRAPRSAACYHLDGCITAFKPRRTMLPLFATVHAGAPMGSVAFSFQCQQKHCVWETTSPHTTLVYGRRGACGQAGRAAACVHVARHNLGRRGFGILLNAVDQPTGESALCCALADGVGLTCTLGVSSSVWVTKRKHSTPCAPESTRCPGLLWPDTLEWWARWPSQDCLGVLTHKHTGWLINIA